MRRFRPMVSRRVPSASSFAEFFLAPGPQAIGQTGDNSYDALFGRDWLLVWDRDTGFLHAFQEAGGAWVEVTSGLPPVFGLPAPVGSRRWSMAFDQTVRVILAYEDSEGLVRVTRWDPSANAYVQNVTFSGVDPVVVMDASWRYQVPDSDVLLFYLSSDRERVMCRVQRDVYGTEYEIHDYGAPVILDRVIALPIQFQVLVSDAAGSPLPDVLRSDFYPYPLHEALSVPSVGPTAGVYTSIVQVYSLHEHAAAAASGPAAGAYTEPLLTHQLVETIAVTTSGPTAAVYADPLLFHSLTEQTEATVTGPTAGAYTFVILESTPDGEAVDVLATGPSGGTYA